jgi:uncharacterized membrane protein affecting hemolysin expression
MIIRLHLHRLPQVFFASLGGALVLLVVSSLWWWQARIANNVWLDIYGSSLARMAAHAAVDATLNQDLVSLHVVLQDVAQNPYVAFATIQNVENRLLVQAGRTASPHELADMKTYSEAITFQQNVAGYVVVNLAFPISGNALFSTLAVIMGVLIIIALISFATVWRSVFEFVVVDKSASSPPEETSPEEQAASDEPGDAFINRLQAEPDNPDEEASASLVSAEVLLEIHDCAKLMNTLSADLGVNIKRQLLNIADMALADFGGHWLSPPEMSLENGMLLAGFSSEQSEESVLYSAALFAAVVKTAFSPASVAVSINAMIGLSNEIKALEVRPCSPFAIYFSKDSSRQLLAERLRFHALDAYWWQVDSFDEDYQTLIDQHVYQIAQHLAPRTQI